MRTGFGDFLDPEHPEPNWFLRNFFLGLVDQVEPAVLEDLRDTVFPLYRRLDDDLRHRPFFDNHELRHGWAVLRECSQSGRDAAAVNRFADGLLQWARGHGIGDEWVLNRALATMYVWCSNPEARGWAGINRSGGHTLSTDMFFGFFHLGWIPTSDTRKSYREVVRKQFERELTEYLDRVEVTTRKRGLVRTPELRRRGNFVARRLEWLVRWQVQGRKYAQIAGDSGTTPRAVEAGTRQAASEIGLRRRLGTPGRPRKAPAP